MANATKRLSTNVAGSFYVDATCINCDTCRQLAPETFVEQGDYSSVYRQPETPHDVRAAYRALLACPVGSIGALASDKTALQAATADFPMEVEDAVYYCGFNSEKSFGGNSYFVRHPAGNWLIDSPRYMRHLVDAFEHLGGIAYIFLTHEDDVADAERYAKRFGAKRLIHHADLSAQPEAEWVIEGTEPTRAGEDFLVIPVPGHTPGSMALLYRQRFLFSGDHLWWERESKALGIPSNYVWDRGALIRSTEHLLDHRFEWVLPGHGERVHLPVPVMKEELGRVIKRRRSGVDVIL